MIDEHDALQESTIFPWVDDPSPETTDIEPDDFDIDPWYDDEPED